MSVVPIACALTAPLNLSDAVFGDGLVLSTQRDGRLVLHEVSDAGRIHLIGTFDDPAAAWRAVDAFDIASGDALAA